MADGTYERRAPREAELKRLQRLIAEARMRREQVGEQSSALNSPKA